MPRWSRPFLGRRDCEKQRPRQDSVCLDCFEEDACEEENGAIGHDPCLTQSEGEGSLEGLLWGLLRELPLRGALGVPEPPLCRYHTWSLAGNWALRRRAGKGLTALLLLPSAICSLSWSYSRTSFHSLCMFFLWKVILAWAVCLERDDPVTCPWLTVTDGVPEPKAVSMGRDLWETLPHLGVPCWLGTTWLSQDLPGARGRCNGDREMDSSRKGPRTSSLSSSPSWRPWELITTGCREVSGAS